jgi:signal-transduction protein with cAMP-binding, CBS, and nucleotidyltransferase domain
MYENIYNYQDEEMFMRRQFVQNIPYFRGLNDKSLSKIVLLIEPKTYEVGDLLPGATEDCEVISILWNGYLQVRAHRHDLATDTYENLWFDTIEKGTCFNVYNAWNKQWSSLLNF